MSSYSALSQNGQNETGVYLNRQITVQLVQGLINCDYGKKENELLTNTLEQKDVMITELGFLIKDAIRELEKRDDIISRNALTFDLINELNQDLKDIIQKEKARKKANKWIYFGLGVAGGIVGYKYISK
jgi:arginine deiminase